MLSTRTVLSPVFQTVTSSCRRSPGVTIPSSAVPSMATPAAVAIARSSNAALHGVGGSTSRSARTRYGSAVDGRQGVSAARAESMSAA